MGSGISSRRSSHTATTTTTTTPSTNNENIKSRICPDCGAQSDDSSSEPDCCFFECVTPEDSPSTEEGTRDDGGGPYSPATSATALPKMNTDRRRSLRSSSRGGFVAPSTTSQRLDADDDNNNKAFLAKTASTTTTTIGLSSDPTTASTHPVPTVNNNKQSPDGSCLDSDTLECDLDRRDVGNDDDGRPELSDTNESSHTTKDDTDDNDDDDTAASKKRKFLSCLSCECPVEEDWMARCRTCYIQWKNPSPSSIASSLSSFKTMESSSGVCRLCSGATRCTAYQYCIQCYPAKQRDDLRREQQRLRLHTTATSTTLYKDRIPYKCTVCKVGRCEQSWMTHCRTCYVQSPLSKRPKLVRKNL